MVLEIDYDAIKLQKVAHDVIKITPSKTRQSDVTKLSIFSPFLSNVNILVAFLRACVCVLHCIRVWSAL